ncbi:DUF2884 family protein [Frateuria terrea]|uniref:DUF2884 family protein n=1 Tax=Frateuria terrea TaxID=529704 RepID=A0A1H6S8T4_9GAMM|nr:DUF2884 family protein [Frateuria terrea]SEI62314.1 Protein of unknown function [Frateuria terrea]SFP23353.1 Protein of unknown function [Frateuria terrea]
MRLPFVFASLILSATLPVLHAQDLAAACQASSSYDLTVKPDSLLFDRPQPAPFHVQIADGSLHTDGKAVRLRDEDQDRLVLFERELRALVPRVRTVADAGVDLAVRAVHDEAAGMQLAPATMAELDRRLATQAGQLRQRIAQSNSTHDWQGDAAQQLADRIVGELAPLVAADLGQQALAAAMNGDLAEAARLRDEAADLATQLQPRLQRRMQALRPQVQALCPSIRRLADLQQGVRGADGQPLGLVQVGQ